MRTCYGAHGANHPACFERSPSYPPHDSHRRIVERGTRPDPIVFERAGLMLTQSGVDVA